MIWHDFMFACGYYPDFDSSFCAVIEDEAAKIIRALRNHPSIVLWCGNNENQTMYYVHKKAGLKTRFYGYEIYHDILPKLCTELDSTRPYWPSSPYGGEDPNDVYMGDRHSWEISLNADIEKRTNYKGYALENGKFISEFGILAPPSKRSMAKYLSPEDIRPGTAAWEYHNNFFEKGAVRGMIDRFYGNADAMGIDEYITASQLIQAEALSLALESFRRKKFYCSGGLFWMYSDCWGTTGWTIIDYYLDHKPSYYYVKKAFAPVMVTFEEQGNALATWVVNDTLQPLDVFIEFGYMSFNGAQKRSETVPITVPANASIKVSNISLANISQERIETGFCFALVRNKQSNIIAEKRHFLVDFKDLKMPKADLHWRMVEEIEAGTAIEVYSDNFAWFVQLDAGEHAWFSDNYFDIWPGQKRKIYAKIPNDESLSVKAVNARMEGNEL